jgi:triacylglycerol lipase
VRSPRLAGEAVYLSPRGEFRYGFELARLASDPAFLRPRRQPDAPPVLLIPGFMAGDQSLAAMRGWLRRRGSRTESAGLRLNVDCAERIMGGLQARLERLADLTGRGVVVIGQSRGGSLGRVLAVRNPDAVATLVMLGSPVLEPLSVGHGVLGAVRSIARLGDLGVPRMFSSECAAGDCCSAFRAETRVELPADLRAVSIYSRSDGIVSWRACLDPSAEQIEVDSSHTGMSVNRAVYAQLSEILDAVAR